MLRVLVVDDHAIMRQGVIRILADELQLGEVGEAGNVNDALALLRKHTWDLVIMDISMPGRSGQDGLSDIKYYWPSLPVLMLSMYPEDEIAVRLLKAGASGYLVKDSACEDLVKAVRKVIGGGRYVSERMSDRIISSLHEKNDALPHESLSSREFEVMLMLAAGRKITAIAADLALSVKTVSTYHARLLEKMNLSSDAALITYCVRHRLTEQV